MESRTFFGEKNCVSCHMTEVEREIVPGLENEKVIIISLQDQGFQNLILYKLKC